jgi:hypothetical protein
LNASAVCWPSTAWSLIVVGGQAEALMGPLNLTLRGAPPDLKFRLDAQALALGQNYSLRSMASTRSICVVTWSRSGSTTISYPTRRPLPLVAVETWSSAWTTSFASSDTSTRPKDRESLLQFEAIKRLRQQEGLR